MITIFRDFDQFSAKNGDFLEHLCCDNLFLRGRSILNTNSQFVFIFSVKIL
jgi:hypothetical protein